VKQSNFPQHGFDNEFLVVNDRIQTISTRKKKKEIFLKEAKESGANVIAYGVIINNAAIVDKDSICAGKDKKISKIIQSNYNIPSYNNMLLYVKHHPFVSRIIRQKVGRIVLHQISEIEKSYHGKD